MSSFDMWLVVFFFVFSLSLSSFFYTKKRNLDQQSQHSPVTNMAKVTALGNLQQAKKVMSNDFPNLSSINR